MAQKGFLINSAECTGCKACELACKDVHSFEIGPRARIVREGCGGGWTVDEKTGACTPAQVFSYSVSYSCGHCENPACVEVCPTGAHHKDEETGIVSITADDCIGCQSCVKSCPYGAPQYRVDLNITQKCDGCYDLRAKGIEPDCVQACLMRALTFGDMEETGTNLGKVACAPESTTSPATYVDESAYAASSFRDWLM